MMYSPSTLFIGLITPTLGTDILRHFGFFSFFLLFSTSFVQIYTTYYLYLVYGNVHFTHVFPQTSNSRLIDPHLMILSGTDPSEVRLGKADSNKGQKRCHACHYKPIP